jgi:hypothetical protein
MPITLCDSELRIVMDAARCRSDREIEIRSSAMLPSHWANSLVPASSAASSRKRRSKFFDPPNFHGNGGNYR